MSTTEIASFIKSGTNKLLRYFSFNVDTITCVDYEVSFTCFFVFVDRSGFTLCLITAFLLFSWILLNALATTGFIQ